jgi:SAM-dependent methyltransferase
MSRKFKYTCETCSLRLEKKKHLEEHLRGKRHRVAVERADYYWKRFQESALFEPLTPKAAVANSFSFDIFLDGLQRRTRMGGAQPALTRNGGGCISPHVTLGRLDRIKRAMLWRYLEENAHGTGYPEVLCQLEREHGERFTRIKEILESVEAYRSVVELLGRQPAATVPASIHDVACGHGLAGLLLAARYPDVQVVSSDLTRRDSYAAHLQAWRAIGRPLEKARFVQANFTELYDGRVVSGVRGAQPREDADPHVHDAVGAKIEPGSLILCIHGCNDASRSAIELAREHGAGWLVMPCCMTNGYAPTVASLRLSDEQRFSVLCGALAAQHQATVVWSIEPRVSPRNVVLADLPSR